MVKQMAESKSKRDKRKELKSCHSNTLYQETTPLGDILDRKKSPITQIAEASKTRYTKDLEKLRQKALKML
ncbi:hypothetical protein SAMN04487943_10470 [Gracilibacillus orientalis]|uniref:Uncharacterized protein n=1 Tax=Gracilibacillus orientalis TaxID=334253 RepID=A0A1I4KPL1_9BACI|nr:hypothetical protein [Gracilibacillus orientalis]SFL80489.1 hypothetical protein SAMN04487943_10470 [Gracilibacillus orientalis]